MFSYYGIAAAITISIINYVLLGFQFDVDGFYLHSFEIWLATNVVFFGTGTVGYSILQYRIGQSKLVRLFTPPRLRFSDPVEDPSIFRESHVDSFLVSHL